MDGKPVAIERWKEAFQAVAIPAGEHQIDFEFRDLGLRAGAAGSLVTIAGLIFVVRKKRPADVWPRKARLPGKSPAPHKTPRLKA